MQHNSRAQHYIDLDRQYVWHPFTPMKSWCERTDDKNIIIERGEREWLIDTDGHRYIDGVSSIWCNIWGHTVPELDEALRQQAAKIAHTTLLGLGNVPSIELAAELIRIAPPGLTKVFYSDNGSTAVEVACKMAYQFWRNQGKNSRQKFIGFSDGYHGDTIGAVSLGGIPFFHSAFKGLCFQADFVDPHRPDTVDQIEMLFKQNRDQYAAVVIEPLVMGAGGMIMHPKGMLATLRKLCNEYDVLLIADEVMTGFGRTGKMFACEHENVTPDLLCLSKGLTAGYMPLGVTLTTQRIYDAFYADPNELKTFFHGHTYTGHPLACAVALKSLEMFQERHLLDHVHELEAILDQLLTEIKGNQHVSMPRRCGLTGAFNLVPDHKSPETYPYQWRVGGALCMRMRQLGLMMRPLGDVIVIMPPLAISQDNMKKLCDGIHTSLQWVKEISTEAEKHEGAGNA